MTTPIEDIRNMYGVDITLEYDIGLTEKEFKQVFYSMYGDTISKLISMQKWYGICIHDDFYRAFEHLYHTAE